MKSEREFFAVDQVPWTEAGPGITDLTLGQTFTVGYYAARRPGMPHSPYRTDDGCTMLEIHHHG